MKTRISFFHLFAALLFGSSFVGCGDVNTIDNIFTYVATDSSAFSLAQAEAGKDTTITISVSLDTNKLFRDQKTRPELLKTAKLTKFTVTSSDSNFALTNFSNIRLSFVMDGSTLEVANTGVPDTAFLRFLLPLTNTDVLPFVRKASFEARITFTPSAPIISSINLGEETAISITAEPL